MPATIYSKAGSVPASYTTLRTNLAINPQLASASTGWSQFAGTGGAVTAARASSAAGFSWWWQITFTTAPTAPGAGVFFGQGAGNLIPVLASTQYTASIYGWINWSGASTRAYIQWYTAAGALISSVLGSSIAHSSGAVERRSHTAVSPANAAFAQVHFATSAGTLPPVNSKLAASGVMLESGAVMGDYFTGDTADELYPPGPDARDYAWSGTANASSSLERSLTYDKTYETSPDINPVLTSSSRSRNRLHAVIGRADPEVSFGVAGLRSGELELFYGRDEAAAAEAEQMFRDGTTFRLVYPERLEWEMTFVVDEGGEISRELDRTSADHWMLRVRYQEIAEASY